MNPSCGKNKRNEESIKEKQLKKNLYVNIQEKKPDFLVLQTLWFATPCWLFHNFSNFISTTYFGKLL